MPCGVCAAGGHLRLLRAAGPGAAVFRCVGRCAPLWHLRERRGLPLCPDSLAALRHIVYGDAKRLYSFTLGSEAQKRLSAAAEAFLAAQLERGFKTLDFYKSVQGMA